MLNISEEQINKRWGGLSNILKEAILSESNNNYIYEIGSLNNLPGETISDIAATVGDVLLGFLNIDDFYTEIKNDLKLDDQTAQNISQKIKEKIFFPLESKIRKNYSPAATTTSEEPFIHPPDHPLPEPIPHEGKLSHLKYQEVRGQKPPVSNLGDSSSDKNRIQNDKTGVDPDFRQDDKVAEEAPAVPFILHQDESAMTQNDNSGNQLSEIPKINISQFQTETPKEEKSVAARVELSSTKLVHYSTYFTKLADAINPAIRDPNPFREEVKKHALPTIIPRVLRQAQDVNKTVPIKPLIKHPSIVPPNKVEVEGNTVYV